MYFRQYKCTVKTMVVMGNKVVSCAPPRSQRRRRDLQSLGSAGHGNGFDSDDQSSLPQSPVSRGGSVSEDEVHIELRRKKAYHGGQPGGGGSERKTRSKLSKQIEDEGTYCYYFLHHCVVLLPNVSAMN